MNTETMRSVLTNANITRETLAADGIAVTISKMKYSIAKLGHTAEQVFSTPEAAKAFDVLATDVGGLLQVEQALRNEAGGANG